MGYYITTREGKPSLVSQYPSYPLPTPGPGISWSGQEGRAVQWGQFSRQELFTKSVPSLQASLPPRPASTSADIHTERKLPLPVPARNYIRAGRKIKKLKSKTISQDQELECGAHLYGAIKKCGAIKKVWNDRWWMIFPDPPPDFFKMFEMSYLASVYFNWQFHLFFVDKCW